MCPPLLLQHQMSSSILHRCPFCGHVTDISEILADFVENPHCNQCGLSASEGNLKLQDDLVALFNKHMVMEAPQSPERQEMHSPAPPPITYSITQHYHHSAHVAQRAATSLPTQGVTSASTGTANWVEGTLRQHGIDPSSLSLGQLELFANAMPEQQSRLIQMWQICPQPSRSAQGFAQRTQISSAGDFEMRELSQEQDSGLAEPYMVSGYGLIGHEFPARKCASPTNEPTTGSPYKLSHDPIYQSQGQRWWEHTQSAAGMEY